MTNTCPDCGKPQTDIHTCSPQVSNTEQRESQEAERDEVLAGLYAAFQREPAGDTLAAIGNAIQHLQAHEAKRNEVAAPAEDAVPVGFAEWLKTRASDSYSCGLLVRDALQRLALTPIKSDTLDAAPGWVMVPVEPTPAMWTAGGRAIKECGGHERDAASLAYAAMISAGPIPKPADEALLRQALGALEYHREQTRPIHRTSEAIATLRARLGLQPVIQRVPSDDSEGGLA